MMIMAKLYKCVQACWWLVHADNWNWLECYQREIRRHSLVDTCVPTRHSAHHGCHNPPQNRVSSSGAKLITSFVDSSGFLLDGL